MNAFWTTLLVQVIKAIVGAVVWEAALQAVTDLLDADMPGDEKRQRVREQLRRAFAGVPNRLLNLTIEAAVVKAAPK